MKPQTVSDANALFYHSAFPHEQFACKVNPLLTLHANLTSQISKLFIARLRSQLDDHRQVHARYDFDLSLAQKHRGDVGRRPAEHVRQEDYAAPLGNLLNGSLNLAPRNFNIVVPAD